MASTKAFYAQIAAGFLLAVGHRRARSGGHVDPSARAGPARPARRPRGHRAAPARDRGGRPAAVPVASATGRWSATAPTASPPRSCGSSCSELCYKAIACDATEDKKHIDLSSEPLILVCAAGLEGSTADDVAKEVAIYRAHKASPIVMCHRRRGALRGRPAGASPCRSRHPQLAFVLAAMAGHLFGYEAALAIDAQARPLREARAAIEDAVGRLGRHRRQPTCSRSLRPAFEPRPPTSSSTASAAGPTTATSRPAPRCGSPSSLRYAVGIAPLEAYQAEHGRIGTPGGRGRRPHRRAHRRASRSSPDPSTPSSTRPRPSPSASPAATRRCSSRRSCRPCWPPAPPATGSPTRRCARSPTSIPAVAEVTGWIRYELDGDAEDGEVPVVVVDRGGLALDIPSRTERAGVLRGTKHTRRPRAAGVRDPRSRGRPHRRDRPRDQGRPGHRDHAAARAVPRPPLRGRRPRRAAGLPRTGGRPCATRCSRPSRPSARTCSPPSRPPTCWWPRWPTWPTTGAPGRRRLSASAMIGIGVTCARSIGMRARRSDPHAGAAPDARCSPTTSRPTAIGARTPPSATPLGSRPRRR